MTKRNNKRAFTLIELLAVLVVLVVILAIAIPQISGIINNVKKNAFKSDIKIIIKTIERQLSLDNNFDISNLRVDNMKELIDISPDNYSAIYVIDNKYEPPMMGSNYSTLITSKNTVSAAKWMGSSKNTSIAATIPEGKVYVYIIGKNKWAGLIGQGTANNIVVNSGGECQNEKLAAYYNKVTLADSGSYIAVGSMWYQNSGNPDTQFAVIAKYEANGTLAWKKQTSGSSEEDFQDIAIVNDGYVAVGSTNSNDGDFEGLNIGENDAIILKYDLNGNVVWKKNFGGTHVEQFYSVLAVNDGYIAVGRSYSFDVDLEGLNHSTSYTSDSIIVKYDLNGNMLWKKTFGGTQNDSFNSILSTTDGYIAVGSSYSSDGDLASLNKGSGDATIVKYDLNGNVLWTKTFGGTKTEWFEKALPTSDGFIAIGSSSSSDGDLTGLNKGGADAIIVKYNTDGNVIWTKTFGGTGSDYYYSIASVTNGYIAVGSSYSSDGDLDVLGDGEMIVKYDLNGNIVWKNNTNEDYQYVDLYGVISDNDEYVAVGGIGDDEEYEALIIKYNSNGDIIWNQKYSETRAVCPEYNNCQLESYWLEEKYYTTVETDGDNYIVTGHYDGTSFIDKYDANGNLIWNKNIANSDDWFEEFPVILFYDIETVTDGYIAVGRNFEEDKSFIRKYSKSGDVLWSKTNDDNSAYAVVKSIADGYLMIVKDYANDFIYLQKTDKSGNITWTGNDGSLTPDIITKDIEVIADGFLTIGGVFGSGSSATANIKKYDLSGNLVWSKNYNVATENYFNGMAIDDTGYIVAGSRNNQALLVKYDVDGNIVWEKTETIDYLYDVVSTTDGYITSGSVIAKFDKNGNKQWERLNEDTDPFLETIVINDKYYSLSGYPQNVSYYSIIESAMQMTYLMKYPSIYTYDNNGTVVSRKEFKDGQFLLNCDRWQ